MGKVVSVLVTYN